MITNISVVSDENTARTCEECAVQRAENLATFGVKRVLELCVGPSLVTLEKVYERFGIQVVGNDIDVRWKALYPSGHWVIGDALSVSFQGFDAVVFAPPLSQGCTGRREDSLMIDDVRPRYRDFLDKLHDFRGIAVMVLPGRSQATSWDRRQFHSLLAVCPIVYENVTQHVVPLCLGHRRVVKYHDLYLDMRG